MLRTTYQQCNLPCQIWLYTFRCEWLQCKICCMVVMKPYYHMLLISTLSILFIKLTMYWINIKSPAISEFINSIISLSDSTFNSKEGSTKNELYNLLRSILYLLYRAVSSWLSLQVCPITSFLHEKLLLIETNVTYNFISTIRPNQKLTTKKTSIDSGCARQFRISLRKPCKTFPILLFLVLSSTCTTKWRHKDIWQ